MTALPASRHRSWLTLAVVSLAQLLVVLDATIVNIALPAASAELQFDANGRQWIVAAYSLAFGGLLLVGGRIGDRIGKFRAFVIGAAGFALASAVGGWAPTLEVLIGARAAQGVFAALLAPAALGLLTVAFAGSGHREKAFAIFGAVSGAGAGIGLVLGGWLTEYFSWRWTLFINVAFALAAIIGALIALPRPGPAPRTPFDVRGSILASLGVLGVVYAIGTVALQPITAGVTLVAGIVLLVIFARTQRRTTYPLLPPSILADRTRSTSSLVMLVASVGVVAVFVFATSYLQDVLGIPAFLAGLAFLPMVIAIVVGAQVISAGLAVGVPLRRKVPIAALVSAGGMVWLAQVHDGVAYATGILPGLLLVGIGLGVIFASTLSSATWGVLPEDSGVASAVLNSAQQIGTSLGVAVLTTLSGLATGVYIGTHLVEVGGLGGVPSTHTIALAVIAGYQAVFWFAAVAFVATALVAGLRYPSKLASTAAAR
ncbi:MFS transporter [Microbacterium sp. 2FI]|uniref:MFS transporter n=1 Tax=Microbacterium sp. 2FI TaxID=2502193 RepID=UPI001BB143F2|nr:MFS transporter [Microbacterium sp. 2FI]